METMKTFSAVSTSDGWICRWVTNVDSEKGDKGKEQVPHLRITSGVPITVATEENCSYICALVVKDGHPDHGRHFPLGFTPVSQES